MPRIGKQEGYYLERLNDLSKPHGVTWIPQYYVKPFFLDFYSPDINLAIEFDETHHNCRASRKTDFHRQKFIEAQGIKVMRYPQECPFPFYTFVENILARSL